MTEIHLQKKYNNMQDQTQYPIVFFGFVDLFQKVIFSHFQNHTTTDDFRSDAINTPPLVNSRKNQ